MPRSRVQHQKGLSDDGVEQRYPDEAACRKAQLEQYRRKRSVGAIAYGAEFGC